MFSHIVVGADGTREGQDAVALGARLSKIVRGELTLVRAVALCHEDARSNGPLHRSEAERQLRDARDTWAPHARIELVDSVDEDDALRAVARRCHADLVVIGSSWQAPLGRCAIGQASRHLLNGLPVAIAVASRGLSDRETYLDRVAVGYDGGPQSEAARQLAQGLAAAADADLVIVTIYELPSPALSLGDQSTRAAINDPRATERRAALALAERALESGSRRGRLGVTVGEPGLELRRVSEEVDLMVIGSRRHGAHSRVILGSAGESLASDCGCSLVVVPR